MPQATICGTGVSSLLPVCSCHSPPIGFAPNSSPAAIRGSQQLNAENRMELLVNAHHHLCLPENQRQVFWHRRKIRRHQKGNSQNRNGNPLRGRTSWASRPLWHPQSPGRARKLWGPWGFTKCPEDRKEWRPGERKGPLLGGSQSVLPGPRGSWARAPLARGPAPAHPRGLSYSLTIRLMWKSFFLRDLLSIFLLWYSGVCPGFRRREALCNQS